MSPIYTPRAAASSASAALSLALATAIVLGAFGISAAVLYRAIETMRDANEWVSHTQTVLDEIERLLAMTRDTESAQRGFTLSGDNRFLDGYTEGRREVPGIVVKIKALTADNPLQHAAADELSVKSQAVIAFHEKVVNLRRTAGTEAAVAAVIGGEGKTRMDALLLTANTMKQHERDLYAQRSTAAQAAQVSAFRVFWLLCGVMVTLTLAVAFFANKFASAQAKERARLAREAWIKSGVAAVAEALRGELPPAEVARRALESLGRHLGAPVGVFYERTLLRLRFMAGVGVSAPSAPPETLEGGHSLLSVAVAKSEPIVVTNLPASFLRVSTALGEARPAALAILPTTEGGVVNGVLELAALEPLDPAAVELLAGVRDTIGSALASAMSRERLQDLLEETQRQAEELQAQQEELRVSNEELEAQAQALRLAQDRLQTQQEELRQTNEELEQQAKAVEEQRSALAQRNAALEDAQEELVIRGNELARAGRYKSEFLANMSHELRTPLNSLLILSTLLAENKNGRLDEKQVGFAQTIYRAGNDLLALINDVLDLSKVEAGKLDLTSETVSVAALAHGIEQTFGPLAGQKGIALSILTQGGAPTSVSTDPQRVDQIIKNLVSNAVKFTSEGMVEVTFAAAAAPYALEIRVRDTGIGIPKDKAEAVFEAFEQVDGSTSRAFGGTGLGLTISRELARLLGGTISLESELGKGSTFTLALPAALALAPGAGQHAARFAPHEPALREQVAPSPHIAPSPAAHDKDGQAFQPQAVEGDVSGLAKDDRLILVIEDDRDFGMSLVEVARESGFKAVLATSGEAGLDFARRQPVSAILLDIKLPDVSGLSVLESLKRSGETRHVPIHIISGVDHSQNALRLGAVGYLVKPAEKAQLVMVFKRLEQVLARKVKRVLVVEDDQMQREAIAHLLGSGDVEITAADTAGAALTLLKNNIFDCMVLDLRLPDMSGFELLEHLGRDDVPSRPPVVVYTGKDLSGAEQDRLARYADSIIVKGVRSPERLLDEVSLFLHRLEERFPADSRAILERLRAQDKTLAGRKILLVDDDMRNLFALVNALDTYEVKSVVARNGKEALQKLEADPTIELVLMDIMMPIMDGYEAMGHIRRDPRLKKVPIIALTAKAMKGDQERCLAAGANDYLPKPVNLERLTSLLKVWLPRRYD